jgi:hypothetical protein
MADLLQKVYLLFVRPAYSSGENLIVHKGPIYRSGPLDSNGRPTYIQLSTGIAGGSSNSPVNLNGEGTYTTDTWFLHSSYTSYEKLREELKSVIARYGTEHVRCAIYIPIDYSVIPNE